METVSNISTRKELYCQISILSVDYTIGFKYKRRLYSRTTGVWLPSSRSSNPILWLHSGWQIYNSLHPRPWHTFDGAYPRTQSQERPGASESDASLPVVSIIWYPKSTVDSSVTEEGENRPAELARSSIQENVRTTTLLWPPFLIASSLGKWNEMNHTASRTLAEFRLFLLAVSPQFDSQ